MIKSPWPDTRTNCSISSASLLVYILVLSGDSESTKMEYESRLVRSPLVRRNLSLSRDCANDLYMPSGVYAEPFVLVPELLEVSHKTLMSAIGDIGPEEEVDGNNPKR